MSILTSGPETWPWVLWAGGDPCMTGCLECPLVRPILAQSWSQTATDGAWYSTTALLSDHDRPQRLYVLKPRGSEPKTQWTGSSDPPFGHQPPRGARHKCGARLLSTANDAG